MRDRAPSTSSVCKTIIQLTLHGSLYPKHIAGCSYCVFHFRRFRN
uniref:Hypotheticial protein n=1 Tax=Schistosoma japonicum TaxID=6182 RepID=C1L4L3_SCHJA|nr:hypotheticial protein [Schistosoma japonicum]